MTGKEVRERFLKYFEKHEHKILSSSSLVPAKDPSLLFTNAGMVQFKGAFLGIENVGTKRATTSQKCLRVSGKHNDLENVGYTARHHTFFEMLGNFSFGDYFKKEAIFFGWDFLVHDLGLDPSRLYVSVFEDDAEAYVLWNKDMGVPEERIFRFGEEDNFWAMGDTGPCGPCSEIIYDQGAIAGCGKPTCTVGCDCDRYLEIWNLVFMQFDRDEKGALNPLPKPSIDTGMGLERITAAMQGVKSNYDTDFFTGLIEKIEKIAGIGYGRDETVDSAMRVIADHGRATAFLIADGVLPSNEGRGYVLRRIMRRALRHGKKLGFEKPFLHAVAAQVVEEMGGQYPELPSNREFIRKVVVNEEERFLATLDSGLKIFEEAARKSLESGKKLFHGKVAFKLYDTFGFPLDLTQDICRERGLEVDTAEFDTEMEKQKERARQAWKGGDYVSEISTYTDLLEQGFKTEFTGYDFTSDTGAVVSIVRQREKVERAESGDEIDLVTNRTPFYAESGGQAGDRGKVWSKEGAVEIEETFIVAENIIVHRGKVVSGSVAVGDRVNLAIEEELRQRTQANHTATHILQAALRDILGDHVRQAGSYVGPDKLRFDYTHFDQVTLEQKREIEEFVNRVIHQRRDVTWELLSYDLALANGAMALFGEKYGDIVRMVKIDGVSAELCGGTHATNTGDLGVFVLTEERALASGVRRMESLTGMEAFAYLNDLRRMLEKTSNLLAVAPEDVDARVEKLLSDMKRLEKEKEEIRKKAMKGDLLGGELKVEEYSGVPFAHRFVEEVEVKILREMMDELKGKLKKGVIVLGTKTEGKCTVLVGVTRDISDRIDARKIVDEISRVTGGSGGGRADLAQTGSTDPRLLETAVDTTKDYLKNL